MKAEIGKRYAQIVDGRVHWTFTQAELSEWQDDAFGVVDVTNQPEVVVGYVHRGGATFNPPLAPPPPGPRIAQRAADRAALLVAAVNVEADVTASSTVRLLAEKLRKFLVT